MLNLKNKNVLVFSEEEWNNREMKYSHEIMAADFILVAGRIEKFRPINYTNQEILDKNFDPEAEVLREEWRSAFDAAKA